VPVCFAKGRGGQIKTLTLFQYKYSNYEYSESYINADCVLIVHCFSDGVGFEQKNDHISYIRTHARAHTHTQLTKGGGSSIQSLLG